MTSNNICVKLRNLIAHSAFRIVAALLFAAALQARATEYWVATDGADTNPGTSDAPFATLEYALSQKAQNGDTVKVRTGTYTIPAQSAVNTPAYNLTNAVSVIGVDGPENTIFAPPAANKNIHAFRVNNVNATLSGVTVTSAAFTFKADPYYRTWSPQIYVLQGLATNCVVQGITAGGHPAGITAAGGSVVDCVVSNITHGKIASTIGIQVTGAAIVRGCRVIGCPGQNGRLNVSGANAVVRDCVVTRCSSAGYSAYVTGGNALVENCTFTNNSVYAYVNKDTATLRNCLIANNSTSSATAPGGILLGAGTVESCTVAYNKNTATITTGAHGVLQTGGTILNSIIAHNATDYALYNDYNHVKSGGTCTYTCTYPAIAATGNNVEAPCFADASAGDFTLGDGSELFDAGLTQDWMASATDLAGNARVSGTSVNLGAYEGETPAGKTFAVAAIADADDGIAPLAIGFSANLIRPPSGTPVYSWNFGDGETSSEPAPSHTFAAPGKYTVRLTVTCGGEMATTEYPCPILAHPTVAYVSTTGSGTWPYDTWDKATNDLREVLATVRVPADGSNARILVGAGTYSIPATELGSGSGASYVFTTPAFNLNNAVSVIAVEGPEKTVITGNGTAYRRAFRLNNADAVVSGFAIENVFSESAGKVAGQNVSAFMHVENGLVTNCVIRTTPSQGSGSRAGITSTGGTIVDCVVSNLQFNSKLTSALCGISVTGAATVRKCRVIGCTSKGNPYFIVSGANAVVSDCEVARCSGGTSSLSLTGAGAQLSNCVITNNAGSTSAVSVNNATATLRNCLVAGNSTSGETSVGGIYLSNGTVENCTVASNRNTNAGATCAGVSLAASADVVLRNVISWGNTLSDGSTGTAANFKDAGADEGAAAQGTVETCLYDQDPLFKNAANGDYSLASGSPARDAGTNQEWMKNAFDLAGNKRRAGRVDIGCYESQSASFFIIVR